MGISKRIWQWFVILSLSLNVVANAQLLAGILDPSLAAAFVTSSTTNNNNEDSVDRSSSNLRGQKQASTAEDSEKTRQNTCDAKGYSQSQWQGRDSPERLLLREGVIDKLPDSKCGNSGRKNVILAIGDGMGYEMVRAGSIARQVLDELATLGCNTTVGCPSNQAAKTAFKGRRLTDYYTEGSGSGLSFQNLNGFAVVTTSAVHIGDSLDGNHQAPGRSMLGSVDRHGTGMSPLIENECGLPIDFNPNDISEGGNMVLWNDTLGGTYPWHEGYNVDSWVTIPPVTTIPPETKEPTGVQNSTSNGNVTVELKPDDSAGVTIEIISISRSSENKAANESIEELQHFDNYRVVSNSNATSGPQENTTTSPNSSFTEQTATEQTTVVSTKAPTRSPTISPTVSPTSAAPTQDPSTKPTTAPSASPTRKPTPFDPLFIMQHAVDSAASATCLATGQKVANRMVSVNLYEEEAKSILEEAMTCGMAGGAVTSVPMLHATPAAFLSHSNDREKMEELRRGFWQVKPTLAIGTCSSEAGPSNSDIERMEKHPSWNVFKTGEKVTSENFFDGIESLHPDRDHVVACLGDKHTLPYRGVDSSYTSRWCGRGDVQKLEGKPIGVKPNNNLCNINRPEEVDQIPHIATSVEAALGFLSKSDEGMFLIYEQGDIDVAAHANHMDDLLGAILDFDESVGKIIDFIEDNGGWDKHALYVTADHDHYLSLLPNFPEVLANLLITGESHKITPESFSNQNPWSLAIDANRHQRISPEETIIDHLRDFSTWSEEDIGNVGHFWGPEDSGGNGWASHSARPVPIYFQGDGGCLDLLTGKGYTVLGKHVRGSEGKNDQTHVHACMTKALFGY